MIAVCLAVKPEEFWAGMGLVGSAVDTWSQDTWN